MVQLLKIGKKIMKGFPKQSSVYWFDPEPVRGSEMRKVRPCIVVSPNEMNEHLRTVVIVPLTSAVQTWPFRLTLSILNQKSSAACDQIRSIDKSRLKAHIGDLKPSEADKLFTVLQAIFSE